MSHVHAGKIVQPLTFSLIVNSEKIIFRNSNLYIPIPPSLRIQLTFYIIGSILFLWPIITEESNWTIYFHIL